MSAINEQPVRPAPAAALSEPSMEDILASIRRIIAEDTHGLGKSGLAGLTRTGQGAATGRPAAANEAAAPVPAPEMPGRTNPTPDTGTAGPEDRHEIAHVSAEAPIAALRGGFDHDEPTVSQEADRDQHASERAVYDEPSHPYAQSAQPVADFAAQDSTEPEVYDLSWEEAVSAPEPLLSPAVGASVSSSFHMLAETMVMRDPAMIERVMQDTLRPMLKTWLENNLPSLVERLVRAEIERVARGGRS